MVRYISAAIISLAIILTALSLRAEIITIPDDYNTIQEGIDNSSDGDTVLVMPGEYTENINFNGHNILLCSMFLPTGDTSYISSTVINGDSASVVVTFEYGEDSTATICGFTLQNGYYTTGGGIYCWGSSPNIVNNRIIDCYGEQGGGIYLWDSESKIEYNLIINNVSRHHGGGIRAYQSSPEIRNNVICDNLARFGGGISCTQSDVEIINNSILLNRLADWDSAGGGIYCERSSNVTIKNSILWADDPDEIVVDNSVVDVSYCDIRGGYDGEGIIDINPMMVDPAEKDFNICLGSPCLDAGDPEIIDPDGTRSDIGVYYDEHPYIEFGKVLYISHYGNDSTGDGSIENPYRTIQHGIDMSFHRDTVLVMNGIYVEHIDFDYKCIVLASNYVYSRDTVDIQNTVIDGDSTGTVIRMFSVDSLTEIRGLTIQRGYVDEGVGAGIVYRHSGIRIFDNRIIRHFGKHTNSALNSINSDARILNNEIRENTSWWGRTIGCRYSKDVFENNLIAENHSIYHSGIYAYGSVLVIRENTIRENTIIEYMDEGGTTAIYFVLSTGLIENNFVEDNFSEG